MEAKEVVASYFDALAKGELEKALSSFTPETKWCQSGDNQFTGVKKNLVEIIEMFQGIMNHTSGSMRVRPSGQMLESGNLIAVPVWFTAKTETKTMELGGLDIFEVKEGKIIQVWTFSESQFVDDAFFGSKKGTLENRNSNQINITATEVVTGYSVALAQGDIPTAFSHFSPDAKWHQPGNHQFAGTKEGIEAIGKMLGDMMGTTQGSLVINPTGALMANGNLVSFPVHFTGKIGDKTVDMNGVDLFEVVDRKIVQVWLFSEDQASEDEFWGN